MLQRLHKALEAMMIVTLAYIHKFIKIYKINYVLYKILCISCNSVTDYVPTIILSHINLILKKNCFVHVNHIKGPISFRPEERNTSDHVYHTVSIIQGHDMVRFDWINIQIWYYRNISRK